MTSTRPAATRNGAVGVVGPAETSKSPAHSYQRPASISTNFSESRERYTVSISEYISFHDKGYLVVRGLVSHQECDDLRQHVEDLVHGRVEVPGLEPPAPGTPIEEVERRYLRVHMLHRHLEIHERFLLHPRILDVLEALIGPDVMALQSMLFIKAPGGDGQGYHQDSYYIPTYPDTLCGAWLAVDPADQENGCLWVTSGSQHEPIYPTEDRVRQNHSNLEDLSVVENVSHTDTEINTLSRVAAKYEGREEPVVVEPGDVIFFAGHVLHRSHSNRTQDRFRRSFVGHYANARSFTKWGARDATGSTNHLHILARGTTHLPYGSPRFGTPCAANSPALDREGGQTAPMSMMADGEDMQASPQSEKRNDPALMSDHESH